METKTGKTKKMKSVKSEDFKYFNSRSSFEDLGGLGETFGLCLGSIEKIF